MSTKYTSVANNSFDGGFDDSEDERQEEEEQEHEEEADVGGVVPETRADGFQQLCPAEPPSASSLLPTTAIPILGASSGAGATAVSALAGRVVPPPALFPAAAGEEGGGGGAADDAGRCSSSGGGHGDDLTQAVDAPIDVAKRIMLMMGPNALASFLNFSTTAITNSFVGRRLGAEVFAYFTLGVSVMNLFGMSIGFGLNGALITFISQAYGRDQQATRDIGVSLQRALVVSGAAAVPLSLVMLFGGPLFAFMFGEALGRGALSFTQYAVPNLIFMFAVNIITRVFQSINMPEVSVYGTASSCVACFIANYYLTDSVATGVLSLTISSGVQLAVLVLMLFYHPKITFWRHCEWPAKDGYSAEGIRQYLSVGFYSLVAVCAEWWSFEVLNVVAAGISVLDVAAVNLVIGIGIIYFAAYGSIAIAASVLVGNALGANRPALAKQTVWIGLLLTQGMNAANVLTLLFFRRQIARLFTTDAALEDTFSSMILVVVLYLTGDTTQYCLTCYYRSTGRQKYSAKIVLLSLWAVGVPMAFILGRWMVLGAAGVIGGLVCGFCVEVPVMMHHILGWPWEELAIEASKTITLKEDGLEGGGGEEAEVGEGRGEGQQREGSGTENSAAVTTKEAQTHHTIKVHEGVIGAGEGSDAGEDEMLIVPASPLVSTGLVATTPPPAKAKTTGAAGGVAVIVDAPATLVHHHHHSADTSSFPPSSSAHSHPFPSHSSDASAHSDRSTHAAHQHQPQHVAVMPLSKPGQKALSPPAITTSSTGVALSSSLVGAGKIAAGAGRMHSPQPLVASDGGGDSLNATLGENAIVPPPIPVLKKSKKD